MTSLAPDSIGKTQTADASRDTHGFGKVDRKSWGLFECAALPSSNDPKGNEDIIKAALTAIPSSASQAHFAHDIVSMCLTMQRSCRRPVSSIAQYRVFSKYEDTGCGGGAAE